MPRKLFLLVLACLGLLEAGLLFYGWRHRADPDPYGEAISPHEKGVPDRSLPATTASPTLHIEPDDGFHWLYTIVNEARSSVDLTMYELVDPAFSAALAGACGRGVAVRVILDGYQEKAANTPAFQQLAAAGPHCTVAWSNPQFPATHQKSLIVDKHTAVVMSFNTTSRYYSSTRDFALVDTDSSDIANMQRAFNEDFRSTTDRGYEPRSADNLIWSPTTAQDDLLSLINGARHSLALENEELSASSIVDALAAACKRGVAVTLAMTDTNPAYRPNFSTLQAAGCGVHIGANNSTTRYIHAKTILADLGTPAEIGYMGSINFSVASMTLNRELGLYVHDSVILRRLDTAVAADYATFSPYDPKTNLPNTEPARP